MSGRKINDHANWTGKAPKGQVFADGPHKTKEEHSAEGSGHIGTQYHDTTEQIRGDQMAGDGKIKGRPIKPGYRN